jgi:lipopolysaccharide export LptBFGC system permease protein LptF
MRGRRRWIAAAVLAVVVLGGAAVALAASGAPRTESIMAKARFTAAEGKFRICQGEGSLYQEDTFVATGQATGDARFTGPITARISQLRTIDEQLGTAEGSFEIRDAVTGFRKVRATFSGVIFGGKTYSFAVGKVFNTDGTWMALSANQRSFPEAGAPTLQLGGDFTDTHIPAVIQRGKCSGPWTPFKATFG